MFDLDRGGMESLLVDLTRSQHGRSVETSVLVLSGRLGRAAKQIAPHVKCLDTVRLTPGVSLLAPFGIVRWLRKVRAEVVHLHSGAWWKPALAARLARVSGVLFTEHGRLHQASALKRLLDSAAARLTDTIVAVTPLMVPELATELRLSEEEIRVVMNGVDTERFTPLPDDGIIRAELGIAKDVPIIASVGRYEPVKGCDVLLDAFAILLSEWTDEPAPALVMLGEGSDEAQLRKRRAADPALSAHTFLLPWRNEPLDLLRACTVFVMASRSEGTSVSLLEAMSSGCCPVVTAVGGNPLVLGPALSHRLVPSESPLSLAASLRAALTEHDARARDQKYARARVVSLFSLKEMSRAYEALYRRLGQRT